MSGDTPVERVRALRVDWPSASLRAVTLIDTPGAYPGIDAEERGQSEAIAWNLRVMARLKTPIIATVIGEGGSGGALAIGVCDQLNMLQYSTYSVISPEGCASILWKDAEKMREAAEALRLTAQDLTRLGVVDAIIPEPVGGAQRAPALQHQRDGRVLRDNVYGTVEEDAVRRDFTANALYYAIEDFSVRVEETTA